MTPGRPPGLWRYGWLVFLLLPVASLVAERASAARIALVAPAALVLIGLFAFSARGLPATREVGPRLIAAFALQVVLAVGLTTLESPDWGLAFVFIASGAGARFGRADLVAAIAVLCVACVLAGDGFAGAAFGYAISSLGVGLLMVIIGRLRISNAALVSAREELAQRAVSEERARFARDLHDLLGHSLSVIALKAELAGRLLQDDPRAAEAHVRDVEAVARAALGEVREAVSGYRRPTLAGELAGARLALEAAGLRVHVADETGELDPEADAVLAWAVREGTTNVIRHSGARSCSIVATDAGVTIVDDGRGGDGGVEGNGLDGLRERAERVDGTVEAGPAPGGGGFALRVALA